MKQQPVEILLIDDDKELCDLLTEYLASEGFRLTARYDGISGINEAYAKPYALILLDVSLPKKNGFEVLVEIRTQLTTPVLMLTARGDDLDRIYGLEMGADDYLAKPYNLLELVARIKAILRRSHVDLKRHTLILKAGDLSVNMATREVFIVDKKVLMTASEFTVLKILVENIGVLITKADLTEKALNRRLESFDRSIDMHVSNVRKKIGHNLNGKPRIKTVRSIGYLYENS